MRSAMEFNLGGQIVLPAPMSEPEDETPQECTHALLAAQRGDGIDTRRPESGIDRRCEAGGGDDQHDRGAGRGTASRHEIAEPPQEPADHGYASALSATTGSTDAARRAGA